jgi:hypothetical protein
MTKRLWRVTLYNQAAQCGYGADGPSRPKAFTTAIARAGEPFLREGGDKLTTFRTLFAEAYRRNRHAPHCHLSHPNGASIEWRLIKKE